MNKPKRKMKLKKLNNNILEIDGNVVTVSFGNKKTKDQQVQDDPSIEDRIKRIRQSIDRINTLMAELRDSSINSSKK